MTPGMGNIIRRHVSVRRRPHVSDGDHDEVPGDEPEAGPPVYRVSRILGPHRLGHSHNNLLLPSITHRYRYLGGGHSHSQHSLVKSWSLSLINVSISKRLFAVYKIKCIKTFLAVIESANNIADIEFSKFRRGLN